MSQAGPLEPSGTPSVLTEIITDFTNTGASPGHVIPAANTVSMLGTSNTVNNNNGIQTIANPDNGSVLDVALTNRIMATTTTNGAVTSNIITFTLSATPGAYQFNAIVVGFDAATPSATSYFDIATVRSTAGIATLAGSPEENCIEDAGMAGSDVDFVVTGADNNITVQVLGVAGLMIDWRALLTYTFVS